MRTRVAVPGLDARRQIQREGKARCLVDAQARVLNARYWGDDKARREATDYYKFTCDEAGVSHADRRIALIPAPQAQRAKQPARAVVPLVASDSKRRWSPASMLSHHKPTTAVQLRDAGDPCARLLQVIAECELVRMRERRSA